MTFLPVCLNSGNCTSSNKGETAQLLLHSINKSREKLIQTNTKPNVVYFATKWCFRKTDCLFHAFFQNPFMAICTGTQDERPFWMQGFSKCRLGVYGGKWVCRCIVCAHGPLDTNGHRRPSYLQVHLARAHGIRSEGPGFEWKSRELRHRGYRQDLHWASTQKLNKSNILRFLKSPLLDGVLAKRNNDPKNGTVWRHARVQG